MTIAITVAMTVRMTTATGKTNRNRSRRILASTGRIVGASGVAVVVVVVTVVVAVPDVTGDLTNINTQTIFKQ